MDAVEAVRRLAAFRPRYALRLVGASFRFYVERCRATGRIMSGRLTRFLGDTPLRVLIRLLVLSFIVGLVLSALNIHPFQVYDWVERLALHVYAMGFAFFADALDYLLLGAVIVVPLFLLVRLLKLGGGRASRPE